MEVLSIENQVLNHIPKDIDRFFPNLKTIRWMDSHLLEISADDLKPFSNFQIFSSWHNRLVSIPGDLFKFTPNLQFVRFYDNSLKHVGPNLLADLKDLKEANFQFNSCVNVLASTVEMIQELNQQLPIMCAPKDLTTTTTTKISSPPATTETQATCSAACVDRIEKIKSQTTDQTGTISRLQDVIDGCEKRIMELEMQMREFSASPCSPCSHWSKCKTAKVA